MTHQLLDHSYHSNIDRRYSEGILNYDKRVKLIELQTGFEDRTKSARFDKWNLQVQQEFVALRQLGIDVDPEVTKMYGKKALKCTKK